MHEKALKPHLFTKKVQANAWKLTERLKNNITHIAKMKHIARSEIVPWSTVMYYILLLDFLTILDLPIHFYNSNYICGTLRNGAETLWNEISRVMTFQKHLSEYHSANFKDFEKCAPFCLVGFS